MKNEVIPYGMNECGADSLKECYNCPYPHHTEQCSRLYALERVDKEPPRCEIVMRDGIMRRVWRKPNGRFAKPIK